MPSSSWPLYGKKGRMTDTLWLPGKDIRVYMNWSVPGATGRVWHSMLPREVFNAQQDDRVGYHCVWVKASRSTCYLSLLYLFSKIATFLSEFLLWKWSPSWLAPASHLTAAHSVSQGCPPHNSLPPAPETVTAVSITPIVLGMCICLWPSLNLLREA